MALREMTPEVRNHFETLAAAESGFLKRLFVSDQWLAIVTAIGRSRVPTAIPGLMAYAFAGPAVIFPRSISECERAATPVTDHGGNSSRAPFPVTRQVNMR